MSKPNLPELKQSAEPTLTGQANNTHFSLNATFPPGEKVAGSNQFKFGPQTANSNSEIAVDATFPAGEKVAGSNHSKLNPGKPSVTPRSASSTQITENQNHRN